MAFYELRQYKVKPGKLAEWVKIMEEDMEALGAVRKREVEEARANVMDTAKRLSESGELILPGGGEDDELMY